MNNTTAAIRETAKPSNASVQTFLFNGTDNPLPLLAEPVLGESAMVPSLTRWIQENHAFLNSQLMKHGAILFRNFNIPTAGDFEAVAKAIDPDLKNNYLGTSPRNRRTDYVFSASELPNYYPIPQHCEMSFMDQPPRHLFFYCAVAPEKGGETPLVDFRKVYQQLDPEIREEFMTKGIRNIRNYDGPNTRSKLDIWKLKRWDQMFLTTDKKEVEKICQEHHMEYHWKPNDRLALINEQEAIRKHPETGEPVWFNHLQVFHVDAAHLEYRKIAQRQKTLQSHTLRHALALMTFVKKLTNKTENLAMHCTFRDGSKIPAAYVWHLEEVIWHNMVFIQWQQGDVIAIDNLSTSHGRMPYKGPRDIMVCWSA